MRRISACAAAALATVALLPAGAGQAAEQAPTLLQAKAHWSGELVVDFHGSAAEGCARLGACHTTGHLVIKPAGAVLAAPGILHLVTLSATLGPGPMPSTVISPAGTCRAGLGPLRPVGSITHGAVTFDLSGAGLIENQCGGPLTSDIARRLPRAELSLAAFKHGGERLTLTGGGHFATHGFAGTVHSTITARLGPARMPHATLPASKTPAYLYERLSVLRIAGSGHSRLQPSRPAVCSQDGSCGRTGMFAWALDGVAPTATLGAIGPPGTPRAVLLDALQGRPTRAHVITIGDVVWNRGGTVSQVEHQDGLTCHDRAPLGLGLITFTPGHRSLYAVALQTRCPGSGVEALGTSRVPAKLLRRHTFTVHIPAASPRAAGLGGRDSGEVTVTLRAGSLLPSNTLGSSR